MQQDQLISVTTFCNSHDIEIGFVELLQTAGLIELRSVNDTVYIGTDQLETLERYTRLHFEMDINVEGIETIEYLLRRIEQLQDEIRRLKNRLNLYENPLSEGL